MSKLTKNDRIALRIVLLHAERAKSFLDDPQIAVARRGTIATTTLHYSRADGSTLYEINKEYGSNLTGLESAIERLGHFLATH